MTFFDNQSDAFCYFQLPEFQLTPTDPAILDLGEQLHNLEHDGKSSGDNNRDNPQVARRNHSLGIFLDTFEIKGLH